MKTSKRHFEISWPLQNEDIKRHFKTNWCLQNDVPYARHYNPRFVYFLPHFSVRSIIKSGFKLRAGYDGACSVNYYKTKATLKISWNSSRKFRLCCDDVILNRNWLEPKLTRCDQMWIVKHSWKWAFGRPPNCSKYIQFSVTLDLFGCQPNHLF